MKTTIFSAILMAFVLVSCNQKNKEAATDPPMEHHDNTMTHKDTTAEHQAAEADEHATKYACPMHPEVQGKMDDKCSKCGMKLTEPVAEKTGEK